MCTNCQAEAQPRKQVCCNFSFNYCLSREHSQELNDLVILTQSDFDNNAAVFTSGAVPQIGAATNAQKRLVCYRKLFRLLVGVGTTGLKVTLPSCCRAVIDNTHP